MYKVNHIKHKTEKSNYLEVNNSDFGIYSRIDLNLGGSLQDLTINNEKIITSENMIYEQHFNSAILFPFVNRLHSGIYNFKNKTYKLFKNKDDEGHAIHGLVYNKTFNMLSFAEQDNKLMINLCYEEMEPDEGFPFKYSVFLTYIFQSNALSLKVSVINEDENEFPFAIGWHPYFFNDDLHNSSLVLNRNAKIFFDERFNYKIDDAKNSSLKIVDNEFDDCYILESNEITLETPTYSIKIEFSTDFNYVQVYIPKNRNFIALEPQTGVANNFNNGLGLKTLKPSESFEKEWKITLLNTN
ncbi:MAG: aldose 1-epimerase [Flavobacteriaceae bacterium]